MNLVLISKILLENRPLSFRRYGTRNPDRRLATMNEVKFIMFCFAFLNHGGPRNLFWEWVQRERHLGLSDKRGILSFSNPETSQCDSLEFLDLIHSSSFISTIRVILGRMLSSNGNNLSQVINSSFGWSDQPEGHRFWSNLNADFENVYNCLQQTTRLRDENAPAISFEEMRDHVLAVFRRHGIESRLNQFCNDYPRLLQEREERFLAESARRYSIDEGQTRIDMNPEELDRLWDEMMRSAIDISNTTSGIQWVAYGDSSQVRASPSFDFSFSNGTSSGNGNGTV